MKSFLRATKTLGVFLLISGLMAITAQAAIEGGDTGKGKDLAKEKCKHCHVTGAWDKIDTNELLDIMQFMYDHAADSPQPATCGQ